MARLLTRHVFISYSRKDEVVLQRVVNFLKKEGITVWVDNNNLKPGTRDWEVEIENAIISAGAVIVLLSPGSYDSEWVRREISFAENTKKEIVPVLIGGDDTTTTPIRLQNYQRIDIRGNEEDGLNSLVNALVSNLEVKTQKTDERMVTAKESHSTYSDQSMPALLPSTSESANKIQRKPKTKRKRAKQIAPAVIVVLIGLAGVIITAIVDSEFIKIIQSIRASTPLISTSTPVPYARIVSLDIMEDGNVIETIYPRESKALPPSQNLFVKLNVNTNTGFNDLIFIWEFCHPEKNLKGQDADEIPYTLDAREADCITVTIMKGGERLNTAKFFISGE